MRAIKESMGRDIAALRAAVDVGTRDYRGQRDGGLTIKWIGVGLSVLIILVRTFAPLFDVPEANLPGLDTLFGAISLSFGIEGFYLFRRSYDMRREDKNALMNIQRAAIASQPPASAPPPPIEAPHVEADEPPAPPEDPDEVERSAEAREARTSKRESIRARLSGVLARRRQAEEEKARGELHRPTPPAGEEGGVTPSGADPSSPAPSGAAPLIDMIPPRAAPEATPAPPVVFPEDDGLGDLLDDPEQRGDDEDRETGAAPGRPALAAFNFDDDDFDNSFAPFADDPAGGVKGFDTESGDVEQPRGGPRGRPSGPRGRSSGPSTR